MNRFLFLFLLLVLIFFLQQQRFLSLAGLNPNLLLITFLIIVFHKLLDFKFFLLLAFLFLVVIFYLNPFYAFPVAVLTILTGIFGFLIKYLTGWKIIDFILSLILSQITFYFLLNFQNLTLLKSFNLLWEIVYNLVLGTVIFLIYEKIRN